MRFFHITSTANAEAILKEGFRDGTGHYLTDQEWTGVWVSTEPFDGYDADAKTLFTIEIPEDVISEFEWVQPGMRLREFLVPAALLNSYGPPVVTGDYDDDEIVVNPDPEEDELLIEWANERPNFS
jgi:hypothetical protein